MNSKDLHLSRWQALWYVKIRLPHAILLAVLFLSLMAAGQIAMFKYLNSKNPPPEIIQTGDCPPPPTVRYRMNEYKFTHPLLLGDRLEESKNLHGLKNDIASLINQKKQSGLIDDASVYIKMLNAPDWICVNPGSRFNPGSLLKVPVLINCLRQCEVHPELLDKKMFFDTLLIKIPKQTFNSNNVRPGKYYSFKELCYAMIVHSDNYATYMLNAYSNVPVYKMFYSDLGLTAPEPSQTDFTISTAEYSKFLRVLYNSSYLSIENSDYALSLLSQSEFNEGLLKDLPPETTVAHKFGEWGADGVDKQLHESGIVYMNDNTYLITVMTRGRDLKPLPQVISDVSKLVYDRMAMKQEKN